MDKKYDLITFILKTSREADFADNIKNTTVSIKKQPLNKKDSKTSQNN